MYNNFSNPYVNNNAYYDRLNQMQQQYQQPQQQQQYIQQPQYQQPQNVIKAVTSIEEVRSITPSFDGSKMYFEDTVNKKIYVKYIDLNGLPHIDVFSVDSNVESDNIEYCTKEEYKALQGDLTKLRNELDGLLKQLGGGKIDEQ